MVSNFRMRAFCRLILLLCISITAFSRADQPTSRPASIITRQGNKIQGDASLDGHLLRVFHHGRSETFELSRIAAAKFTESTRSSDEEPSAGGLKAEYFDDQDLTKLKLMRYDSTIDFRWGLGAPDPSVAVDFSA